MKTWEDSSYTYNIEMEPPPGKVVAPDGFPAEPRPQGASKTFLDAMEIRIRVFCDEQKCAIEPELDEDDPRSWQWVLYQSPKNDKAAKRDPVSVIRVVPPPHAPHPNGFHDPEERPYCKLTRVATMKNARQRGLSKRLIEEAFQWMRRNSQGIGQGWEGHVLVHAQVAVEKVYQKLGFETDDRLGRWDEEGIEHLGMWCKLEPAKRSEVDSAA